MFKLIVCLILTIYVNSFNCEFFSSIASLRELINNQKLLIHALDSYLVAETKRLDDLKKIKHEINQLYQQSSHNADLFVANPVNNFKLIKLSYLNSEKVKQLTQTKPVFNHELTMRGLNNESIFELFPDKLELHETYGALYRLQFTYNLDIDELTNGIVKFPLNNITSRSVYTLNSDDLLGIYKSVTKNPYFYEFKDLIWCRQAVKIYEKEKVKSVSKNELLKTCVDKLQKNVSHFYQPASAWQSIFDTYSRLCEGKVQMRTTNFKCYYKKSSKERYLELYRYKVEDIFRNPDVFIFHNVISDDEIEELKTISRANLERTEVFEEGNEDGQVAFYRVSKAYALEKPNNLSRRLFQRIRRITGLDSQWAEQLLIQNYGIGGHYEPHLDSFSRNTWFPQIGNRIATWLTYISDVDAGGHTVFPKLGVGVRPQKGSALFWYNLDLSGEVYLTAMHAACPVLLGSKWVANIWFRELGQEFIRPCGLNFMNN